MREHVDAVALAAELDADVVELTLGPDLVTIGGPGKFRYRTYSLDGNPPRSNR